MDKLFKEADYGTDYRSLNHTARILGNVKEGPVEVHETSPKKRYYQKTAD